MGLRERVTNATHGILSRVLRHANESLDVPRLRRQYGATKGRVVEVRVGNHAYRNWTQLSDQGVLFVARPPNVSSHGDKTWYGDGLMEFRDYTTLVDLVHGKILRRDPKTRKAYWAPFTPEDAFFYGYIRVYGDQATNEGLRFILNVWPQIRERVRRDLGI